MRKYANCDFSFAGLKTSTRLAIEANLGPQADSGAPPGSPPPAAQAHGEGPAGSAGDQVRGACDNDGLPRYKFRQVSSNNGMQGTRRLGR